VDDTASFSNRGNARRAAENMITKGTAPALDYGIKPRDDGRFDIVWRTDKAKASPTTDEVEAEIAAAIEKSEANGSDGGEAEASSMTETTSTAPPTAKASDPFARIWDPAAEKLEQHKDWLRDQAAPPTAVSEPAPDTAQPEPENPWPEGTRVMVRKSKS
jgi:hypothetical protein